MVRYWLTISVRSMWKNASNNLKGEKRRATSCKEAIIVKKGCIMKRKYFLPMTLIIVSTTACLLMGCQGTWWEAKATEGKVSGTGSEKGDTTEEVNQPVVEKELLDVEQQFPEYEEKTLDLESLIDEDYEIVKLEKSRVLGNTIYMVTRVQKENGVRGYYLFSCNLNGENLEYVELQMPKFEGDEGELLSFCIGMDGKIYSIKNESNTTVWSCFQEGCSVVSWDVSGTLITELKFKSPEEDGFEDQMIVLADVSENGEYYCVVWDYYKAIVMRVSATGEVVECKESKEVGCWDKNWNNWEGSLGWTFTEGNRKDDYEIFYVSYEIDSQAFSERVPINKEVLSTSISGSGKKELLLLKEGHVFRYDPHKDVVEPVMTVEGVDSAADILEVGNKNYLIYKSVSVDLEEVYEGIYLYMKAEE